MPLLFRDLLSGTVKTIQIGRVEPCVVIDRVGAAAVLTNEDQQEFGAESCPVPDDLILVETDVAKDYIARSTLAFFGRFRRNPTEFILGFASRGYKIKISPEESEAFTTVVFEGRLTKGTTNVFTSIPSDYWLKWPEISRHRAEQIEEIDHRPDDWNDEKFSPTVQFATTELSLLSKRKGVAIREPPLGI
jgi:hypothetical protein